MLNKQEDKCECDIALFEKNQTSSIYCEKHKAYKTINQVVLCERNPKYCKRWSEKGCKWAKDRTELSPHLSKKYEKQSLDFAVGIMATTGGIQLEKYSRGLNEQELSHVIVAQPTAKIHSYCQEQKGTILLKQHNEFGLWIKTLQYLYDNNKDKDFLIVAPQSAPFTKDITNYLLHDLWPSKKIGAISLTTPNVPKDTTPDIIDISNNPLIVSNCNIFLFPTKIVSKILETAKQLSTQISIGAFLYETLVVKEKKEIWAYTPGLCEVLKDSLEKYEPKQRFDSKGQERRKKNK